MKNVEKWSMGYALLLPLGKLIHRIIHREIVVEGLENIPLNKPVIFAPNHQNALMDALALVFSTPRQIVFLGRADIFKRKWVSAILYFFKILPVYRIRDGKDSLGNNELIFRKSVEVLENGKCLCLFPEAAHTHERSMLAHKKAIPRIIALASQQLDQSIDMQIVPVGITYSHYFHFKRRLLIRYGQPIAVRPFIEQVKKGNERSATIELRDIIFQKIEKLIVNIRNKSDVSLYENTFSILRSHIKESEAFSGGIKGDYEADQYLHGLLKTQFDENEEFKNEFSVVSNQLLHQCKVLGIKPEMLDLQPVSPIRIVLILLASTLLLPVWVLGLLLNAWLFWLTHYSFRKKIRDKQFWSSFAFVLSFVLFPFWYLLLSVLSGMLTGRFLFSIILLIFAPVSGLVAWELMNAWKQVILQVRVHALSVIRPKEYKNLLDLRMKVMVMVNDLKH